MSDIQHLIAMLTSDNSNQRYDACENLRVRRPPLPQEAIDALRSATTDPNADVADAAERALSLHAEWASQPELPPAPLPERNKPSWSIALLGGISALAVTIGTIMPILRWEGFQLSWICIFPFGFGVVGGYLAQTAIMAVVSKQANRGVVFISALAGGVITGILLSLIF